MFSTSVPFTDKMFLFYDPCTTCFVFYHVFEKKKISAHLFRTGYFQTVFPPNQTKLGLSRLLMLVVLVPKSVNVWSWRLPVIFNKELGVE